MQNQKDSSVLKLRQKLYVLATHAKKFGIKDLVKKFIKYNDKLDYDEWKEVKSSVYELTDDGHFFVCSCPVGSKKYFCKHSVGLAIKFKNT